MIIFGTNGNDILNGGPEYDAIYGLGGDDRISGWTTFTDHYFSRRDLLVGGGGRDRLIASASNTLWGDDQTTRFTDTRVSWTSAGNGAAGWHVGDFNGDGRDDIFSYEPGRSGADMFLSNGSTVTTGFQYAGSWTGAGNGADGWRVGDFNGDGRDDIFRYEPGQSGADMFLSTGTSFQYAGSWTGAGNGTMGWSVGDFNGDGKDDIFRYEPGRSGAEMFLSNGTSFDFAGSWTGAGVDADGWRIGDFNGDGRDDILRDIDGAQVFLSTGSSFEPSLVGNGQQSGVEPWYVGNFDGNPGDDLLRYAPGRSGAEVFVASLPAGPAVTGERGSDVFWFGRSSFGGGGTAVSDLSGSVIRDFETSGPNHDVIEINGHSGLKTFEQVLAIAYQSGPNTMINYSEMGPGNHLFTSLLTLENVWLANLTADNFLFS